MGQEATEAVVKGTCSPQYMIYETKRLMGLRSSDASIQRQKGLVRYRIDDVHADAHGCPTDGVQVLGRRRASEGSGSSFLWKHLSKVFASVTCKLESTLAPPPLWGGEAKFGARC